MKESRRAEIISILADMSDQDALDALAAAVHITSKSKTTLSHEQKTDNDTIIGPNLDLGLAAC